jgi:hypothetical protein
MILKVTAEIIRKLLKANKFTGNPGISILVLI